MKKIVLVDDEKSVVESISELVDWETCGASLVATCLNAYDALKAINDYQPDIVITDIKMPVMNGIELIHKVRTYEKQVEFIVLSGYGEFELAKEAMKEGVKYYLLKPCGEEDIEEAVMSSIKEIDARKKMLESEHNHQKVQNELIRQTILMILQRDFSMLVLDDNFPLIYENSHLVCVSFLHVLRDGENNSLADCYLELEKDTIKCIPLLIQINNALIGFYVSHNNTLSEEEIHILYKNIARRTGLSPILLANEEVKMNELMKVITGQCGYYDNFYYSRGNEWIFWEKGEINSVPNVRRVIENLEKEFYENNRNELKELVASIIYGNDTETIAAILINFLMKHLYQGNITIEQITSIHNLMQTDYCRDNLYEIIWDLVNRMLDNNPSKDFVDEMMKYIDNHLADENLNLKRVARELVFLNEDYAGKKFSQKSGKNFTTYLNEKRIEKAKLLLSSSKFDKNEIIAQAVGYGNNPQYFNKIFKKYTGYTPKEYRQRRIK